MSADEVGTLGSLIAHREIMDRLIASHRGRIANTAGDSVLAEFPSVVDAVKCAVKVQEGIAKANENAPDEARLRFRIGVHVGDVMVRGGDLFGDGVNIAARLQALADPGGVCISGEAHQYARKALSLAFDDLGQQAVKNIEDGVRAFAVRLRGQPTAAALIDAPKPLPLPDKPSIAVLPFTNMSGDPEQEYFADGVVESIITALSRVRWFFVIARNSTFTYKGKAVDIRQVGRELGVRYVLEGSVQKAGGRVRITGQLIEAETGHHVWAEKFDGDLADIFDLQDRVTEQVVAAIEPSLKFAEITRSSTKPTENLSAYDIYLRALPHRYALSEAGARKAIEFANAAIELDPVFATAKALAAYCYGMFVHQDWHEPDAAERASALARSAVEDGWDDPEALRIAGHVLGGITRDYSAALAALDRALAVNPNSAAAWTSSGWVRIYVDEFETAMNHFSRAMRLSPLDPEMYFAVGGMAHAHLGLGNIEEAFVWSQKCTQQYKGWSAGFRVHLECLVLTGRWDEARSAAARYVATYPGFRISKWAARSPMRNREIVRERANIYRQLGLPE
jgi:adenylate cyclase